jgi:hypothetical protein
MTDPYRTDMPFLWPMIILGLVLLAALLAALGTWIWKVAEERKERRALRKRTAEMRLFALAPLEVPDRPFEIIRRDTCERCGHERFEYRALGIVHICKPPRPATLGWRSKHRWCELKVANS